MIKALPGPRKSRPSQGRPDLHVPVAHLASSQITAVDVLTVELVEATETPPWSSSGGQLRASVIHPRLFPAAADTTARTFAAAVVRLAQIQPWAYRSAARLTDRLHDRTPC